MGHRIYSDKPAGCWQEAYPIGNGFLGAMVYGGMNQETIQVNEDSLWSGGPCSRVNPNAHSGRSQIMEAMKKNDLEGAHRIAAETLLSSPPDCTHYESLGTVSILFNENYRGRPTDPKMNTCNAPTSYSRELDLDRATGLITFDPEESQDSLPGQRLFFASGPEKVLIYDISHASKDFSFEVTCDRNSLANHWICNYEWNGSLDERTIALTGRNGGKDGIGYVLAVRVLSCGGNCRTVGRRIIVQGARRATVFITARTTFRSPDPKLWCMKVLDQAQKHDLEYLIKNHKEDYQRYYDRTTIKLASSRPDLEKLTTKQRLERLRTGSKDPGLVETYCAFAKYLLISSSRPSSLPANLQGLWCKDFDPAWGSKYTLNINLEMNYWSAEAMNLPEMDQPLLELVRGMVTPGRQVARQMYGARGFVCHHNTDIWGDCAPVDDALTSSIWPMGAAWLCLHLIDRWRYLNDSSELTLYAPVVQEAVRFLMDILVQDRFDHWVVGPSVSPENKYRNNDGSLGTLCMGSSLDRQITTELFAGYISEVRSSYELGLDDWVDKRLVAQVEDRLPNLAPILIDSTGSIMEWDEDYQQVEPGHRHFSPLFGLYPGDLIRKDTTPELASAAMQTLTKRIRSGAGHPNAAGQTGWSRAWASALFARLGDAEEAWSNLIKLVDSCSFDNLMNADDRTNPESPFQIDGNLGGLAALLEMLVRDYGQKVLLLPALPQDLSEGQLRGIVCRAGCTLDISWKQWSPEKVILRGRRDGQVTICWGRRERHITFKEDEHIVVFSAL